MSSFASGLRPGKGLNADVVKPELSDAKLATFYQKTRGSAVPSPD
jgi:hypothetical protein